MKKLLLISVLAIIAFSSCKKEEETFCWDCVDADGILHDNGTITVIPFDYRVLCDKTENEIENYEEETWTGPNTVVIRSCEKQ